MGTMTSQITSLTIVYSTVYSDADQRKHQSSASLAFVRGIHRRPVNSPHKWPVTRKMFPFDDVIMWRLQPPFWCRLIVRYHEHLNVIIDEELISKHRRYLISSFSANYRSSLNKCFLNSVYICICSLCILLLPACTFCELKKSFVTIIIELGYKCNAIILNRVEHST